MSRIRSLPSVLSLSKRSRPTQSDLSRKNTEDSQSYHKTSDEHKDSSSQRTDDEYELINGPYRV